MVATDADINDVLSYSLGRTNAQLFEIDRRSGQLRTKALLDHEARATYSVTVTATDLSSETDSIPVTITVTNVEELGTVEFSTEFPRVGQSLTATLADPDGGMSGTVWEWYRSTSSGGWDLIDGADSGTYSPVDADLGHHLRASVRYTDRHEPQQQETAEAVTLGTVSQLTGRRTTTTTTTTTGGGGGGGGPAPGSDEPDDPPPAGFTDVNATSVHAKNIDALYAAEVTTGCGTDPLRFCPDRAVTRAQMASFLIRALNAREKN